MQSSLSSLRTARWAQFITSATGTGAYSKERVEVFAAGCVAVLDDFRRLDLVRYGEKKTLRSRLRQDKGHVAGVAGVRGINSQRLAGSHTRSTKL